MELVANRILGFADSPVQRSLSANPRPGRRALARRCKKLRSKFHLRPSRYPGSSRRTAPSRRVREKPTANVPGWTDFHADNDAIPFTRDEYPGPASPGFTTSAEIWSSRTFFEISAFAAGRVYKFVIPADGEATRGGRAHHDRSRQRPGTAGGKPQNAFDDRNVPRRAAFRGADLRQRAGESCARRPSSSRPAAFTRSISTWVARSIASPATGREPA